MSIVNKRTKEKEMYRAGTSQRVEKVIFDTLFRLLRKRQDTALSDSSPYKGTAESVKAVSKRTPSRLATT